MQQSLSQLTELEIGPNDTYDVKVMKHSYNSTLKKAQNHLTSFNDAMAAAVKMKNQLNIELDNLGQLAKGLEILYGKSIQFPGTTIVQAISVTFSNEVIVE